MNKPTTLELRRRSIAKSLLWRFIGIVWTWTGAYLIFLLTPQRLRSASLMATAIVVFHHSTRMIMYYVYERIWSNIPWGRVTENELEEMAIPSTQKLIWIFVVMMTLVLLFFLVFYVNPLMKY